MAIDDENVQVLSLVQALIGGISSNFRRVTLESFGPEEVHVHVLLERDDPVDRDEVEDDVFEFEALLPGTTQVRWTLTVSAEPDAAISLPGRVVYGRREDAAGKGV